MNATAKTGLSRRALVAGALVVTFAGIGKARAEPASSTEVGSAGRIGGFVQVGSDGRIVLVMPSVEMGQGICTAEAALLAEELDLRLDQVETMAAPPDASLYAQPLFKISGTVRRYFDENGWPDGKLDKDAVDGAWDSPHAFPAIRVDWVRHDPPVKLNWWRGVGPTQNVFVVESFLDEIAHAAGFGLPIPFSPRRRAVWVSGSLDLPFDTESSRRSTFCFRQSRAQRHLLISHAVLRRRLS